MVAKPETRDPAMLVFGADFYADEAVQLMTCEQEGAYWRCLIHAHREGSIPADVDQIRAIVAKVPAKRFAAVWAGIACKWIPHPTLPGRLVNPRQEKERVKRAESKQRMRDGAARTNATRWGSPPDSPPDTEATRTESPPGRIPSHPIPIPLHPSGPLSESVPSRSTGEPQRDDSPSAPGPAGSGGTASAVWLALRDSSYRTHSKRRDLELLTAATRLEAAGISAADLMNLAHKAKRKGNDPQGLFAHWIDHPDEAAKELGKR